MRQEKRQEQLTMRAQKNQDTRTASFKISQLLCALDNLKKEQFRVTRIRNDADSKANYNLLGSIKQFI